MSNALLSQAAQTLSLIQQSGVDAETLTTLHKGHLSALLVAAKEHHLPPLAEFRTLLRKPVEKLPVWATVTIKGTLAFDLEEAGFVIDQKIREAVDATTPNHGEDLPVGTIVDFIKASPAQLGLDPAIFDYNHGLKTEDARIYICLKLRERGLLPCSVQMWMELCMQKAEPFHEEVVSTFAIGSRPDWRDFVEVDKKTAKAKVCFTNHIVAAYNEYVFARVRKGKK